MSDLVAQNYRIRIVIQTMIDKWTILKIVRFDNISLISSIL